MLHPQPHLPKTSSRGWLAGWMVGTAAPRSGSLQTTLCCGPSQFKGPKPQEDEQLYTNLHSFRWEVEHSGGHLLSVQEALVSFPAQRNRKNMHVGSD